MTAERIAHKLLEDDSQYDVDDPLDKPAFTPGFIAPPASQRSELPTIEKGVPMPLPQKTGDRRHVTKTVWPGFLQSLVPGDSFVTSYSTAVHLVAMAKLMGIQLIRRDLPRSAGSGSEARVWRVS